VGPVIVMAGTYGSSVIVSVTVVERLPSLATTWTVLVPITSGTLALQPVEADVGPAGLRVLHDRASLLEGVQGAVPLPAIAGRVGLYEDGLSRPGQGLSERHARRYTLGRSLRRAVHHPLGLAPYQDYLPTQTRLRERVQLGGTASGQLVPIINTEAASDQFGPPVHLPPSSNLIGRVQRGELAARLPQMTWR
jgi:hypothetical protein